MKDETPLIDMRDSIKPGIFIRRKLWKQFKNKVKEQYEGRIKYFLSYEVNEALDLYLRIKSGELVVYDADFIEEKNGYEHTQKKILNNDSIIVRKFKERFKNSGKIHSNELRNFVIEDCGWNSRTKFYDVRDELIGKGYIIQSDENKRIFLTGNILE